MQQLSNFDFQINTTPNGLEKHMNNISNKLALIDNFQFLSFSLDSLVKNLVSNDFKCLCQEFDNDILEKVR